MGFPDSGLAPLPALEHPDGWLGQILGRRARTSATRAAPPRLVQVSSFSSFSFPSSYRSLRKRQFFIFSLRKTNKNHHTQTLLDPHMEGSDPNPLEGSGVSNPHGFEGPRAVNGASGQKNSTPSRNCLP